MDDFADTYLAGATPIPCVRCNQTVKFTDLLGTAKDLGAAAMATGHYIRRVDGPDGPELHRALDPDRDQSYFLFATTRAQLDFLRFPLGGLRKGDVRALAAELGLAVADKPDSQDICFVPKEGPDGGYARVIERLRPGAAEPGDIVHVDGTVLGSHDGVIHYTVGQRRGLGVATGEPLFVVKLDPARRHVLVGPRRALAVARVALKDVNWLGDGALTSADGRPVLVRVRSTRPPVPARLAVAGDGAVSVDFDAPEEGVAPGQAAVLYAPDDGGSRVLGGGWIASTAAA
jgi:tRNA-specific 2-thiouridylase